MQSWNLRCLFSLQESDNDLFSLKHASENNAMALTFPNSSRSFDEKGHRIRFLGYDGMFEIRFFVELDAISKAMAKVIVGEHDFLAAFDNLRGSILDVARKAYGKKAATTCIF